MSALRRHREYVLYLLVPTVAFIAFAALLARPAIRRIALVTRLADRIAGGNSDEAISAIRQMARMPKPPMTALVVATASRDGAVALAAQLAIGDSLRAFDERIRRNDRTSDISKALVELVTALGRFHGALAVNDQPWIATTVQETLRLANRLPQRFAPALAAKCDALLESASVVDLAAAPFSRVVPLRSERPTSISSISAPATNLSPLTANETNRGAITPFSPGSNHSENWRPEWAASPTPQLTPLPVDSGSLRVLPAPAAARSAPMSGTSSAAEEAFRTEIALTPKSTTPDTRPLAEQQTRQLLDQWRTAAGADRQAIEQELTRRGFRSLSPESIEELFSDRPQDRAQLVTDVLRDPNANPRPWLLLLAEDPAADVRLFALTVMATSNDRELLERALELALRDRDPRIADLAARLHSRKSGAAAR
jgi:hypothetical protein